MESAEAVQDVVSFSSNVFARVTFGSVYSVDMGNDTLEQTRVSYPFPSLLPTCPLSNFQYCSPCITSLFFIYF